MVIETPIDLNDSATDDLKKLIRLSLDGSEGYLRAAERADHDSLTETFRLLGQQREEHARQLSSVLGMNEQTPPDSGTAVGSLHQWWMQLRDAVTGEGDESLLAEALRGESALAEAYEKTLAEIPDSPLNATLHAQLTEVLDARERMRSLKQAA